MVLLHTRHTITIRILNRVFSITEVKFLKTEEWHIISAIELTRQCIFRNWHYMDGTLEIKMVMLGDHANFTDVILSWFWSTHRCVASFYNTHAMNISLLNNSTNSEDGSSPNMSLVLGELSGGFKGEGSNGSLNLAPERLDILPVVLNEKLNSTTCRPL